MFKKIFYFTPRVLTILIAGFLYLFTLEAFSPDFGWRDGLAHFALATVVLAIGILAWIRPLIGGWLFIAPLAVTFALSGGRLNPVFAALAIVGILYLAEGYFKKKNLKQTA